MPFVGAVFDVQILNQILTESDALLSRMYSVDCC